jgi:hypothetical protein
MVEEGWKMECKITTGLFSQREHHILGLRARPSPYQKMVTDVIGELVAADMASLTHRENFGEKFSAALGFLSLQTPLRDPSVGFGAFSFNTVKMDLTLLNGSLRRIPITLTENCFKNLFNLCLQHLIEAQLVLCGYCEAIHLGIDVL